MTDEHPRIGSSTTSAALEHLADAFDLQQNADSGGVRAMLAAELRATSPSDATRIARSLLASSPVVPQLVVDAPVDEIARALDALSGPEPSSDDEEDIRGLSRPAHDGPVAAWAFELGRLTRRSGRLAADIGLTMTRRGFTAATTTKTPSVLDDPLLAESTVDALGGKWVEGSFRSLYRAARREWMRRSEVDRVERGLAGLNAVNSPTPEFADQQLQPPLHVLPPVRGRAHEIARVLAALDIADRRPQVLVGAAGYGKSTIALAVAAQAQTDGRLPLWVPAHDRDALVEGLELAAVRTGATVEQVEAARLAAPAEQPDRLWALLDDSSTPWLIILDDVREPYVGHPHWAHAGRVGNVVITSRFGSEGWYDRADVIPVGQLAPEDGANVMLDRWGLRPDTVSLRLARTLSRRLKGMPLALASAGHLAASMDGISLQELVDRLAHAADRDPLPTIYEVGLSTGAPGEDARRTLRLLACFAADEPLPVRVIDVVTSLDPLIESGLVEALPVPRDGQRCVRVHPAIAEQSRRDPIFGSAITARMTGQAIALLRAELSRLDAGRPADWPAISLLEPHVAELVEAALMDDDAIRAALLTLADTTAEALVRVGRQRAAVALLDRALDATKQLGDSHEAQLGARRTAAWMMAFDSDLHSAELQLRNILEQTDHWLGAEHPHTLAARDSAAWLRAERGEIEQGRAELERVLIIRRRVLGDEHPATVATRQRLAWVSALCGRDQYAVRQLREILGLRIAQHGPTHLDVFSTRYRLAWMLVRQGELAQAEHEYRTLRADLRQVVGDRHPLTLMVRFRIGWVLKRRKRFAAARRMYTKVFADQVLVLGHGHPRVLRTQHLLACLDLQLGRTADAVRALRLVAEHRETVLGPDHHDTLISRSYLAWALLQSGDAAAADREFSAIVADRTRVYGPRHRLTLMTRGFHGRVLTKRGMLPEAERRLERLLVDELNILGPDDRFVFETRHALAVISALRGRHEESTSALRDLLTDRERVLGKDHPDTLATRAYLVWTIGLGGDLLKATAMCAEVIADRDRVLGPQHPHTLSSRYREAWLAGQAGQWGESLRLARSLLTDLEKTLGDRHPDTLRCRLWIARALRLTACIEEARREARHVVAAQTRAQGATAVDTLRAREELALLTLAEGDRDEATTALRTLLDDRTEALSADHPDTVRSLALWWQARMGA